jgi:predicted nucleotidyltransferase
MNDNKRKLYDALSNDYDMGTYEQFRKDLEDKDKRRKLYDATSDAYDFGDYDQFEAQLGYGQSPSAPGAEEINSGSAGPVMPKPAMENRNWEVQMGNGHSRATVEKPEPVDVPIPQRPEDQPSDDGTAARSGDVRSYLENANRQQVANLSRDINSRLDEAQTKSRDIYMKEQEDARKGGFLSTLAHAIAASGHNPEGRSGGMSDAQQRTLQGANSELQSEISKLEAAKKAMSNAEEIIAEADKSVQERKFPRFVKGVARGFGDKLFDVNTWDMGVSDTKNSIELLKALRKYDEGEPLSESEQMLLDAKSVELATNAYFGSYIGRGYKAGAVTAQSLPFMLEMAVNPASTLGESTQSMLARYALSRFAKKGATRAAQKFATKAAGAAGRALGDIAGSAVMAGTSGAVRVAGDAIDRHVGDIETDMDGQGQTVFAGHDPESLGKSIAKAFTSTAIENHSEMLGEYFAPALGIVSKLGRKGMEKFGLKKVVDFVDDVSATDAAKLIADFQKRTKWHGTIGEYAEEVAGNIENAILVGDNTLDASDDTGVFNLDQNIDTFLGVALMGGVFSAVRTIGWRTPKYRARMEMEKARNKARTKYGSEAWQEIEDRMAEAGDAGMSAVLSTVIAGENSPEKAKALLDYAKSIKKYEGMLAGDEKRREIASPEATDLETSYENGYTLSTPQEVHDAKLMFEYQEAMLQKALGTTDIDIDTIMLGNEMGTLTDEQKSVAMDYLNAKATFDGVIDRVRDDIDSRISSVENAIDASTNRDTGMLQPASLVDDRPVHIISGIVRLTPDGTMVDTRNSENFIIVRDDRTGRMETISPSDINRLENEIDPSMEKQAARQQIQDVYGSREADSIDGVLAFNPGDTYTLTNEQGQSFPVQIVANEQGATDNGDGTVNVVLNNDIDTQTGQPRITQMPKEQIQEMAEATNLSRLQQYEQQKLARAAEQAETDATGRTPENPFRINDRITLSDAETGNVENGVVGSELTDDGKYEVVVEKQDGSQSILYLSPSELEQLGAKLEQPEAVEEQNSPVLEQNQPVLERKTEKTEQESAMSRIPLDREGVPQFEQAQPSDTWEALLELNSGNAVEAEDTARQMYENASKNLDKAQKTKPKSGTSVMEIQRNKAERNGQIDELRKSVDFWGKVLSFPEAVRKSASAAAAAEVRQKEDAKREAVRQAKENLAKGRKLMQQKGTYYKDDAKLGDYLDFHDYALRMIANGRVKFVWKNDADNNSIKGLGGHLGLEDSESERKALFSLLANQDKGGLRPDDAAEQLSEEYNSSLGAEVISSSEALDVILDIIRTYGGKTRDMMNAAIDAHAMAGMDERGHDEDNKSSEDKDNSKIAEGQESLPADAPLSNEMNEFGVPFIESSDGTTVFGVLTDDSGLSPAPIKLSLGENAADKNGTNHGYGLLHIEAGHGDQIRAAGYSSIKDFVEDVARNYDTIREGGIVANNQTYLLELSDEHNNTLFIQLSRDGSYWNINSAGIFKKKYSRRKPEVFTRPALKTETDTDSGRVDSSRSNGVTAPAGNSHQTSEGKDTNISEESNTGSGKSVTEQITEQREVVNTEPTEAQKEAGNYRMGHVKIDGMDVTIENTKGSIRRGTDADGNKWESEMHYDYGYIRGTKAVDNDHIDIFLSDNPETGNVFVVDQVNPKTGEFDESKVMYGFASEQEARDAYLSNYEKGWKGLGKITEVTKEEFKKWIESSTRKTKPFSEYASVKTAEAQKEKPVQGLEGYSRDEIKGIVTDHINDVMRDYDIDAEIIGMDIHGSRNRHDARPDSDLDVVVEYSGDIREDDMFNALNGEEDALSIEGIKVDINPIRKEETGDLQEYMKQSEEYDKEKSEHAKQKGPSAASEVKSNKSEKIEDYGEQISGARKDMLRDLAKTVQNTSLESLISLPFSKAFKKPNLRKAVEEGALRDKDARFAQAAIAAFLSTKKPVAGTKDERRRQRWGEKTNVEKWAEKAYTGIKILQELFDADERVRDKVIEAAVADKYVGVAEAKAQQQRIGELNYREFNGTSYPLNLIALYNEVFDRLGYPAGQDTKIPVGRIVCDSTFDSYSLRGTNGEDWLYSSRSLKSFEDVVDELVYLIKVANADETADHPIENFKIRGINPKVETTGYRVLAAKNLTTAITRGNRFAVDEIFPTREAALKRIEELKATGLECSEPLEKRETVGYEKYQISFAHPITREFIPLEKEYDSKEEAISAPEAEHEELNRLANEAIAAATRKSGESVEKSYFHITHYYDKGSDGKYHWYYGVALDDKYGPKKTAYNTMPFFLAERLNSREEAQKQIEANKERWESLVKDVVRQRSNFVYFSGDNETRKGEDYRNGKDVTAEEFANKFGFRGVQFGNWANQADRQAALNNAYDSFMDMSKIIGVSPKAMSLNGELGVAFGSRGSGAASAHYEPGEVVINLTKTRGAGSLAHEWWHALDNYFSRAANVKLGYVTSDKRLPMREEMRKAFNDLVDDVEKSDYHTRSMDRGSGYWGTRVEETARLFAEWIADEMAKRGELNNFLAGRNDSEDSYARMGYVFYTAIQKLQPEGEGEMMTFEEFRKTPMALKGFSYPTRAELETLGKDVRNIFGVVQERTDETTGNVALFQMVDKILSDNSPENRLAYEAVSQMLSNAGIPMELLSDQAMREMAINATMLDTALPEDESSFKGTVISSIDGAKILNNLDKAIDRYNENPDNRPSTFIGDLASALGSSDKDKSSQYATFETKNGQVVTIRVSNHNATVSNFDNAGESNGISIVISRKPNEGITNDGDAHIVEFFYPDKALNKADGKPLVEILKSIKQSLYSGEYKDTTGLAQREEVNAKESVEFLREPDGTVYGATVGGKIYLNQEHLNPNTPIHEYTHLWFSALEKANPELYKRGVELMKQLPIWEEVKTDPNYANLSGDDAIASECLSRLVGDKGAEKLTELAKKAMVRGDIIGTANRISLIEEFKDWLKKFWTWVRDSFAPWSKEEASRVSVDDIQNMVLSDLAKGVNPLARQAESDPYIRFSIVKDPKLIEELDKGAKVRVYRAMQLIDGKLYPPMASKINGEFVRPIELGKWEQADEHPELIDKNGRFNLNKGNGKGLKAAYNPYIHTSRTPLNDQFSEAQSRPNIVTVEVEIPKSELSSGYKADKAKDSVGEMEWKAGIVQGQLTGKRKVILSRWDKPIRIVPDSEVANVIVNDMFKGRTITMPSNVVTPSLRAELEKLGVPFVQTDNTGHIVGGQYDGKHYSKVYGNRALTGNAKGKRIESDIDRIVRETKENGTYMKAPNGKPTNLDERQWAQVRTGAFKKWFGDWEKAAEESPSAAKTNSSKIVDENGEPKVVYHGSPYRFFRFDKARLGQSTGADSAKEGFFFTDNKDLAELFSRYSLEKLPVSDVEQLVKYRLQNMSREELNEAYEAYRNDSPDYQDYADEAGSPSDREYLEMSGFLRDGISEDEAKRNYVQDSIENKIEGGYFSDMEEIEEELSSIGIEFGNNEQVFLNIKSPITDNIARDYFHNGEDVSPMTPVLQEAKRMGHDGVVFTGIVENGQKGAANQYVAFEPGQIKSATDNVGTFDGEQDDIRYRDSGQTDAEYMSAIESGDMRKAGRMVEAAFRKAFPGSKVKNVVYHGVAVSEDGRQFPYNSIREGHFTDDEGFAEYYAGSDGYVYKVFLDIESPLEQDFRGQNSDFARDAEGNDVSTRTFARRAKESNGRYDGAIISNVDEYGDGIEADGAGNYDGSVTDYIPVSADQIYSAEPVVYDDNGQVVPLSKRFVAGNPDIRYKQDGAVNGSRAPQDVEAAAARLAESLGEKVRIVRDVNEIENRNKKVQESQRRSKGWFNTGTGEIVVVLPNATGIEDVQATIMHEAVGHKGLRELVGDDRFDDFLDKVYAAATKATRLEIVSLARRNHWDFRLATEEYIAGLAENGFSGRENRTLFGKIKDFFRDMLSRAKIALGFNVGDNELRYMLWRTYQMRTSRGILAKANDMAIQQELKVGNFREDQLRGRNGFTENDIAEMETPILESRGTFAKLADAEKWAKDNLQGKTFVNSFTGDEINISGHSIKEMLAPKFSKAINEKTHMAAIMSVPDFIETGIPAEIHKDTHGRGYDVMRLYNAIVIDGEPYRVKSTVKRYVDGDRYYTYEIQEMELLKGTQTTALGLDDSSRPQLQSSITGANLLKGVKKTNSDEEILSGDDSRLRFRTSANGGSSNTARDIYEEKTRVIDRNGRKSDTANLMRRLKEAYVDSMQSLKYLQDAISEETGKPVEDFENAYLAENSMSSKNKAQTDIYLNRFFNPIKDAIRDLQKEGAEYGDIVRYLMAKHGLERNEVFSKRDAEKDGGVWDGSVRRDYSGLTELTRRDTDTVAPRIDEITSRAEDIVRKFEMDHDTDVLWEKINAATKDTLRTSYVTGMLTKDNYEMVRSMFRYYIPLRGWSENTASAVYDYLSDARPKTSSIVKAATGRTTISDDPIATIAYMGQSAIIQGNRNLMKQKLLNLALNHKTGLLTVSRQWEVLDPVTGMWTPRDPDIPADAAPEQVADIVADFEKDMKEAEKKGVARLSRGKLDTGKHLTAYEGQEHIIKVKRGGIDYSIYLNGNPRAAQAVNGMTNPDAVDSWLIRKARVIKNFMARMFTSQNPAFIISNLSRDVIFAGAAVYVKEDAKYAARYAKNITAALAKGQMLGLIHRFETDRLDNSKDLDRYFGEFIRNGGETGFTQLNTVDDFKRDIDRFAREMKQGQVMKVPTKVWNGIWDGIEYMNRCAEDVTRFSAYMTSRQMGRSVERSISDAKEITVNFNRKGSGGYGARLMNFAYVFFNAAVQSLANAGKMIYEHPAKVTAILGAFSAAGFMAPLLAQAIISAFGGDDDAYWDLPEWVRRNNFVFYIPWSDNKFLIIPISQELRPFYAMGEIAMSVLMGKEEVLDGLKSAAGSFMDLLPIDFMGNGGNLAISLTPTVAQPFAQLVANTDYFGSPIYRRNDYNKLDPAWTKAYKGTSPMLVNASKWLNEVTGGDDVKRGWIDPINNPAVIEHLFESYLGGTGKTINRAAKTFSMIWNPDMRDIRNVPIASTFIQESDDERVAGNQLNREYFKLMDEFKETSHTVSGYKKKARMGSMEYADKLNEFMETPDFERYSKARGYANTISKLRQALKRAQESGEDVMVEENLQQILHDLKRQMVEELKEQ